MLVQKGHAPCVNANSLPHPVTQHEAAVKDGDHRLRTGRELAINVDEDRVIARIRDEIMSSKCHVFDRNVGGECASNRNAQ